MSGQLPTAALCALEVLPALLAVSLAVVPWREPTMLIGVMTLLLTVLCACALLFWTDALPGLPRARLVKTAAHRATQRSLFYGAHATLRLASGGWALLVHRCTELGPARVGELILEELRFLVLPGHSLSDLAVHVTIAVLAVYVVIDAPNTSSVNRYLWGASQ